MPKFLHFKNLRDRRIVNNRATLGRWIKKHGFPQGTLIGPNTRVWTEEEIADWFAERGRATADAEAA